MFTLCLAPCFIKVTVINVPLCSLRFFPLLAKQKADHAECDILLNVFALLSSKNVSDKTASMVMDICENLLNTPDFTPSETETALSINGCVIPKPAPGSDDTTGRYPGKYA